MSRVLFIQLSDIHFKENDSNISLRSSNVASAVQQYLPLSTKVVIIATGDISQSGKSEQFKIAKKFIQDIANDIQSRHGIAPNIVTVPGNHDADFDSSRARVRSKILKQLSTESAESIETGDLDECVVIFSEYQKFSEEIETIIPHIQSPIWKTFNLEIGEQKLEIHCVNNAWSCEKRTDPGTLGFPVGMHANCAKSENAFRVLLMHHPAHWIASRQFREFRKFSRECAEICFTGHEHQSNVGQNNDSETGSSLYVEGSVLQDHDNLSYSGFNVSLLDFDTNNIETVNFIWQGNQYLANKDPYVQPLPRKADVVKLKNEWNNFITDLGSNVSHHAKESIELSDLYVYPDLEKYDDDDENPVLISSNNIAQELAVKNRSILIKGDQSSGKTALLKSLYINAIDLGMYPVFIAGAKFTTSSDRDIQKIIDKSVNEQYTDQYAIKVLQAQPDKRILLIDNIDRYGFPDRYLTDVLNLLDKQFNKIIATTDISFDLKEVLLTDDLNSFREFEQFKLPEFSFRLRFDLVSKWFSVSDEGKKSEQIVEHADKIISRVVGRGLIPSHPLYILIILQSIEFGQAGELENSALGYYYEYMILTALGPKVRQEHVHEILNYCSQFAWFLNGLKKEKLDEGELRRFHAMFEDKFDLKINFEDRKELLLESKIFLEIGLEIGFRYPYSYYFFLGRFLSKSLSDLETRGFINNACANLHTRENANAMLFLAHHSNEKFVFDALMHAVDSKFVDIPPIQFSQDTKKLDELVDSAPLLIYNSGIYKQEREARQKTDQRIEAHLDEVSNGHNYDKESVERQQALDLVAEVNGLFKGIEILGAALKSNFGSIDAETKQQLIDTLFRGGLRGLRIFIEAFTDTPDYLLAELAVIFEENENSNQEDKERAIKIRIFHLIGRFSFWFIQRVGNSVGSKSIAPALARYVAANNTIANQLIATASTLEMPGRIPFKELQALNQKVSNTAFAQSVLRLIVITRMYMYKTEEAEKQQVCEELGIRMSVQHAIEYQTRKTKRIVKPN